MPSKRRTSQKKQPAKKAAAKRSRSSLAVQKQLSNTQNDIFGVIIGVIAVALFIALLVPSSALITSAVSTALSAAFGVGALLFPLALFIFAMTFFLDEDGPISGRVALGLLLIMLSVLTMLSLNIPGADVNPALTITKGMVELAGGFVGGGFAWVLLSLVGPIIGNVFLAGIIIIGAVVCGFSITNAVASMRRRARDAAEQMRENRELRREERELALSAEPEPYQGGFAQASLFDDDGTAHTSFIGNRMTSVLKRSKQYVDDAKTNILRTPHPDIDVDVATRAVELDAEDDSVASREGTVPEFLKNTKTKRAPRAKVSAATSAESGKARPGEGDEDYKLPPLSMLSSNPKSARSATSVSEIKQTMRLLQTTLGQFGLSCRVVEYVTGPLVTTFHIEMGEGERVNKIVNLSDDIALALAAESVRIIPHIPGTSFVGIEIPNSKRENVHLGDVLPYAKGGPLEVAVGRDSAGEPIIADLDKMPHMLVAGTTGSGKSVMINSMIMSLLMRATPKQVRLILVDPKRVEFGNYNGLPHLYVPVVTEPRQAASALAWACSEMDRRLKLFERSSARDIGVYNSMVSEGRFDELENPPEALPYLVVIIDELSDLMMVAGKDVESSVVRLAQLGRAAGIHLVVATQRPSANVVTGLIKSNIATRAALEVSSSIDSRVILDEVGAEKLLGNGDMLFKFEGTKRTLGCYTSDSEIDSVVDFIRSQGEPDYHEEILTQVVPGAPGGASSGDGSNDDPLIWEAAQIIVDSRLGSTSGLQRQLSVGYARAGRIMDMLEAKGIVGPPNGSKPREVLIDADKLEELRQAETAYQEV